MRIDAVGRVGIGMTPEYTLDLDAKDKGSSTYSARFTNSATGDNISNILLFTQGEPGTAIGYLGTGGSNVVNGSFKNNFVIGTKNNTSLVLNTNDTERMRIGPNGDIKLTGSITDQDGVRTFTKGGTMVNNTAYTFDIAVPNDTGYGTVHRVSAMMTHYDTTYGCVLDCYAYTRDVEVTTQTNLVNQSSSQAGGWTVTKPNNTTLRITKTAGTYVGIGNYQVVVVTKTP